MDTREELEIALETRHLVFVLFYADESHRYEWIDPIIHGYEKRMIELIRVDITKRKDIADLHNIKSAPAFLLLHGGHELWRQVGELTVRELKDVLEDFR